MCSINKCCCCCCCKDWLRRDDDDKELFFRGWTRSFTSSEGKSYCFSISRHFGQCYCMLPTLREQFGEDPFLFQHYCAPVHQARSIKTWLDEFGVEELNWPTQSPDLLNPIKHLWDELEQSQAFSSNISDWPHKCSTGWMGKISHRNTPTFCGKPQKNGSCYSCKEGPVYLGGPICCHEGCKGVENFQNLWKVSNFFQKVSAFLQP